MFNVLSSNKRNCTGTCFNKYQRSLTQLYSVISRDFSGEKSRQIEMWKKTGILGKRDTGNATLLCTIQAVNSVLRRYPQRCCLCEFTLQPLTKRDMERHMWQSRESPSSLELGASASEAAALPQRLHVGYIAMAELARSRVVMLAIGTQIVCVPTCASLSLLATSIQ